MCLEAPSSAVFVSFGALQLAGDFASASNSVFTLGVPSVFLLMPLFTPLLQGVSGDIILGLSHVVCDGGETSGVISCGSMPYRCNTESCTHQTGLEWGGRDSFMAIDWILISNWRFEIPEAFSYFVVSF